MSFLGERNAIALGVSQHLAMGGPNLLNKLSPSLLLQFAGAQTLDPRITFSRTSNATLTGPDGLIAYAPHNLLTYSEQFDNAAWTKINSTITANSAIAPNGTTTADTISDNGTTPSRAYQVTTVSAGVTYTASIYLKAGTQSTVFWREDAQDALGLSVNLSTGTVTSGTGTIESVGNGWYRVTFSGSVTGTSFSPEIRMTSVGTVYAWGAQLNVGALQPYYPTTVKNLLGYTQEFDNAAWTKEAAGVGVAPVVTADAGAAPDGSMTADQVVYSLGGGTTSSDFSWLRVAPTLQQGTPYTQSVWMRTLSGTAQIINDFDAANSNIETVTTEWQRFDITKTATTTGARQSRIGLRGATGSSSSATILIWGAQLSDSASLDQYVYNPVAAPAAAAYYGPRFDYDPVTLAPKGLLIEESRTNLLLQSGWAGAVAGTPGTAPTSWSFNVAGGSITAVIPNTINQNYIEFSATVNRHFLFQSVAVSANTTYVFSAYVGANSGIPLSECIGVVGLPTGATSSYILNGVTDSGSSIPTTGSRIGVVIVVSTTAGSGVFRIGIGVQGSRTGSVSLGQPQLEAGAFATSYIPTTTAAATRAADVATMIGANFSNWYNQSEGTFYVEAVGVASTGGLVSADDGSTSNRIQTILGSGGANITVNITTGGVAQATLLTSGNTASQNKTTTAYKSNDAAQSVNGSSVVTDTSVTIPTVTQFRIGNSAADARLNGSLRRIAYYPRRLANAELQAITS